MRRFWPILVAILALFLAGCQATATEEPVPTATEVLPTAEPTEEVVAEVDTCLSCHTDKEQLIATAKPEEAAESESKGVG
ncbi:MAG: hypothetical protein ACOYYU_09525 [Chloroflexota bacterium]